MTEKPSNPPDGEPPSPGRRPRVRARPVLDDDRLRALLRHASDDAPELLGGVQRRIRERSRGRFYADGWSRSRIATSTYVVTSLLVLALFVFAYWVMSPSLPLR